MALNRYGVASLDEQAPQQTPELSREATAPIRVLEAPPAWTGGTMDVEGVGEIGPGPQAIQGTMERQKYGLNAATNARAEESLIMDKQKNEREKDYLSIAQEDLGIRKQDLMIRQDDSGMRQEKFGWEREDRNRQESIRKGMMQASQEGGYTGVIEYLKQVDPVTAVKFHADKLLLDDSMMKNEVYQASIPAKKAQAMVEGYGVLSKMGAALLQAPENQREALYQNMLPMVKQVNPDAPDKLDASATAMFMLTAAQGMDANQISSSALGLQKTNDAISKNVMALKQVEAKLRDNPNDPNLQSEYQARKADLESQQMKNENLEVANTQAHLNVAYKQQQTEKVRLDSTLKVKNDLFKASEDYIKLAESYRQAKPLLDIIDQNPNDANARIQLKQQVARMTEKGTMTDQDIMRLSSAAGYASWSKQLKGYLTGQTEVLNNQEVVQLRDMISANMAEQNSAQRNKQDKYAKMIGEKYSTLIDYKSIPKPTDIYEDAQLAKGPADSSVGDGSSYKNGKAPTQRMIEEAMQDPQANKEFVEYFGVQPSSIDMHTKKQQLKSR